jgi:hypothetical protein
MGWPQWIMIALWAWGFVTEAARDGEPRTGTYSVGTTISSIIISAMLLYLGGFFGR